MVSAIREGGTQPRFSRFSSVALHNTAVQMDKAWALRGSLITVPSLNMTIGIAALVDMVWRILDPRELIPDESALGHDDGVHTAALVSLLRRSMA